MSGINPVAPDSDYLKVSANKTTKQELDKDAFMNLLITQMKYQDPLNPMDNQEMMAQLAQFHALEQMTNVAQTAEKQFASGMIGKYVSYEYLDPDTSQKEVLFGKVDYVKINSGDTLIGIGDKEVKVKDVKQVVDSTAIEANDSAFQLTGKTVQGLIKEKNSQGVEVDAMIEGEVLGVSMKDGKPYLIIGTGSGVIEIERKNIQNIVDKPAITGKMITAAVKQADGTEQVISGIAEYVKITKEGTYVYVEGQLIDFEAVKTLTNK